MLKWIIIAVVIAVVLGLPAGYLLSVPAQTLTCAVDGMTAGIDPITGLETCVEDKVVDVLDGVSDAIEDLP